MELHNLASLTQNLNMTRLFRGVGGFRREVQHLRALGLTKENRVGSKRWGVALRVGIQARREYDDTLFE